MRKIDADLWQCFREKYIFNKLKVLLFLYWQTILLIFSKRVLNFPNLFNFLEEWLRKKTHRFIVFENNVFSISCKRLNLTASSGNFLNLQSIFAFTSADKFSIFFAEQLVKIAFMGIFKENVRVLGGQSFQFVPP